jgi:hypothetical protein
MVPTTPDADRSPSPRDPAELPQRAVYAGKLCCVAQAGSISEADILRATLQAEDIEVYIDGENAAVMLPHLQYAMHAGGGVRVLVREDDLDRARATLEGQKSIDIDPPEPTPTTPDSLMRHAVGMAAAGLLLFPLVLLALNSAVSAKRLAHYQQPANPREYRRNFRWVLALLVVDVLTACYVLSLFL